MPKAINPFESLHIPDTWEPSSLSMRVNVETTIRELKRAKTLALNGRIMPGRDVLSSLILKPNTDNKDIAKCPEIWVYWIQYELISKNMEGAKHVCKIALLNCPEKSGRLFSLANSTMMCDKDAVFSLAVSDIQRGSKMGGVNNNDGHIGESDVGSESFLEEFREILDDKTTSEVTKKKRIPRLALGIGCVGSPTLLSRSPILIERKYIETELDREVEKQYSKLLASQAISDFKDNVANYNDNIPLRSDDLEYNEAMSPNDLM